MKIVLIIKGIEIIAIKIAENGSGLKLKYCPFENGSVNRRTMSTATIRTTPQEIRKSVFGITAVSKEVVGVPRFKIIENTHHPSN